MEKQVQNLLEQISNPILALLLLFLFVVIGALAKAYHEMQKSKNTEVKELNTILMEVRESDKEMLTELKNTISRYAENERNHMETAKTTTEVLRRNNEMLMQLLVKIEYQINKK